MYTQDGLTLNILQVVSFKNVIALTEHLVPILLSFYIGSWSDRFGRKPFLAFCMIGRTLGAVGNLISGIWLDEVSRWEWLALYMPVQNISGGTLTFIMMTYSFIADNSTPRLDQRYTGFIPIITYLEKDSSDWLCWVSSGTCHIWYHCQLEHSFLAQEVMFVFLEPL